MPDTFSFDLTQLVRVCLNDPDLRAQVTAALEAGPLPVRTTCANVIEGDQVFVAVIKTDRDKAPGQPGFIAKDSLGWISGKLSEVVESSHDAMTMSADAVAELLKKK